MPGHDGASTRPWYLLLGVGFGVLVIAALSLALDADGEVAHSLLDMHAKPEGSKFPYPFTIHNTMTMLWCIGFGDILHRFTEVRSSNQVMSMGLLPEDDRTVLMVADLAPIRKKLLSLNAVNESFTVSVINECILRFQSSRAIDQTHNVLSSMMDLELHKVDLRYTLLRYISWLLPTIGFIGTVVGIWLTLAQLGAGGGDDVSKSIADLAGTLAMAFTTTMLALVESAVIVGLIHVVQQREETSINRAVDYCLKNLVDRLYVADQG